MNYLFIVISVCISCGATCARGQNNAILFPDAEQPVMNETVTAPPEMDVDPNSILTMEDFANFYDIDLPPPVISTRRGESKGVELPEATCIPELKRVALNLPVSMRDGFFPKCVRVKRCGGCCALPFQECQPTETETLDVKIMKFNQAAMRRSRRRVRREAEYMTVKVEQHLSCLCDCKLRESTCNTEIQTYDRDNCACVCNNEQTEQVECANRPDHFWEPSSCQCRCITWKPCSTGLKFSQETCNCERV